MQMDGIDAPGRLPGKRRIQLPAALHPDPPSAQGPVQQLAVRIGADEIREHDDSRRGLIGGAPGHLAHVAAPTAKRMFRTVGTSLLPGTRRRTSA